MFSKKPRIETPFLKGYVRRAKSYPPYVPSWVGPGAWGLFALLFAISIPMNLEGLGLVLAGAIAWVASIIASGHFKPTTAEDRFDEAAFGAIRRLKFLYAQGIRSSIPERILVALEKATESYNTACARIALQDPVQAATARLQLERHLHACFVAAMPMIKDDQHSRKEWESMKRNNALISQIIEAIDDQTAQMHHFAFATEDRIAALGELGLISGKPTRDTVSAT